MDRMQAHIALSAEFGAQRAAQYIEEAEHQEGYGYWDAFDTRRELIEDAREFFSLQDK